MTCPRLHSKLVGESRIESGTSDFQPSVTAEGYSYQATLIFFFLLFKMFFYFKKLRKEESVIKK
jgi:hypothetical protein